MLADTSVEQSRLGGLYETIGELWRMFHSVTVAPLSVATLHHGIQDSRRRHHRQVTTDNKANNKLPSRPAGWQR
jgi:hypothetical protein